MVLTKKRQVCDGTEGKKKIKIIYLTSSLGVLMLISCLLLTFFDPVIYAVQYRLRLDNGTLLNELLLRRFTSTKIHLYLFNVSNAQRFLDGLDPTPYLEEVGPFVYQEYRSNKDVEINLEPGVMRYTPRPLAEFLPEESVGDPEQIYITVPNIAMLAATDMISKYPYFVRQIYNMVVASSGSKPFVSLRAHEHMWGYSDPLIQLANNVVPGLIYFKSLGLFERLYDVEADYRLELGTTPHDKFSVKKVYKMQKVKGNDAHVMMDGIFTYNDTYEGAAFPPNLTPQRPIFIYRHGLCKTLQLQYRGTRGMEYGGAAFVYQLHEQTFRDRQQCDTKGWCPEGLFNIADCYFGFPIALSKGHFLDSDPELLNRVSGLKPNRSLHDTNILVDPIIGVGITGSMSLQLNLVLGDVGFNPRARRLRDTVLPVCTMTVTAPPMIEEVAAVLELMYRKRAYINISAQVACAAAGTLLLWYAARMLYSIRTLRKERKQNPLLN